MAEKYSVAATVFDLNPELKLWRYMGMFAFLSLLQRREAFFARLSSLEDPYEGIFPGSMRRSYAVGGAARITSEDDTFSRSLEGEVRMKCFVNCWHQSEFESAAMWKLYAKDHGIAIQSTIGRLTEAITTDSSAVSCISVGPVKYVDFESEGYVDPTIVFLMPHVFLKRHSFEHEKEFRAAIMHDGVPQSDSGIYLPLNLETLIEAIYVAPQMPEWMREIVERELKLHGVNKSVVRSPLYDRNLR